MLASVAADAVCFPALALDWNASTMELSCTLDDFVRVCPTTTVSDDGMDDSYADSLYYGAMNWLYDMINVKPVWEQGISELHCVNNPSICVTYRGIATVCARSRP